MDGQRRVLPRGIAFAATAAGLSIQLALVFLKPLWADEIFTLDVARRSFPGIVAALRTDSGPPLHYFVAHALLLPFGGPGPADVVVRLLSLLASALHVPLLLLVARRLGRTETGWPAAALFSLLPVAASFGSEGRGYALASLLVLAAFERSLALGERPLMRTAVTAGALAGLAFLTHYLALFPLLGIALVCGRHGPRKLQAVSAAVATAAVLAWLPVAAGQPRAAMAWVARATPSAAIPRFLTNVSLGIDDPGLGALPHAALAVAALLAAGLILLAFLRGGRAAGVILGGGALLVLGSLAVPELLLPERSAVLFLPYTALALASTGPLASTAAGFLAAAFLGLAFPSWIRSSPQEALAARLLPPVLRGAHVVAVGPWGPELGYRMARAGHPGAVDLFPSDVEKHPGWYAEEEVPDARLLEEATRAVARQGDLLFVLPRGSRASEALRREVERCGGSRVGSSIYLEILRLPGSRRRAAATAP